MVEIDGIWLRTIGERIQVLTQDSLGCWYLVIDEDRNAAISHIAEPHEIADAPADEVTKFSPYIG